MGVLFGLFVRLPLSATLIYLSSPVSLTSALTELCSTSIRPLFILSILVGCDLWFLARQQFEAFSRSGWLALLLLLSSILHRSLSIVVLKHQHPSYLTLAGPRQANLTRDSTVSLRPLLNYIYHPHVLTHLDKLHLSHNAGILIEYTSTDRESTPYLCSSHLLHF